MNRIPLSEHEIHSKAELLANSWAGIKPYMLDVANISRADINTIFERAKNILKARENTTLTPTSVGGKKKKKSTRKRKKNVKCKTFKYW